MEMIRRSLASKKDFKETQSIMTNFDLLPDDVLVCSIFQYVGTGHFRFIAGTCKRFRFIYGDGDDSEERRKRYIRKRKKNGKNRIHFKKKCRADFYYLTNYYYCGFDKGTDICNAVESVSRSKIYLSDMFSLEEKCCNSRSEKIQRYTAIVEQLEERLFQNQQIRSSNVVARKILSYKRQIMIRVMDSMRHNDETNLAVGTRHGQIMVFWRFILAESALRHNNLEVLQSLVDNTFKKWDLQTLQFIAKRCENTDVKIVEWIELFRNQRCDQTLRLSLGILYSNKACMWVGFFFYGLRFDGFISQNHDSRCCVKLCIFAAAAFLSILKDIWIFSPYWNQRRDLRPPMKKIGRFAQESFVSDLGLLFLLFCVLIISVIDQFEKLLEKLENQESGGKLG